MKRLESARIVLEPVTPQNAATLWRIMQSANLREFQDVPRYTREEFERRVAARPRQFDARALGRFEWLIVLRDERVAIGWMSLRIGEIGSGAAEIGYSMLKSYRGRGYAREAARALVTYAFEETNVARIEACFVPANAASRRLLESLGFVETRRQRNGAIVRGRPVDIVLYDLTRERSRHARQLYDESANSIVIPASANPK